MKQKIKLLFVLLFAGILGANAQQTQDGSQGRPRRTVEERVDLVMEKVTSSLQLTATQKTDAAATFTEYFKANEKLMQGLEPGTRPDRDAMMKNIDARDVKLKTIFTTEQFTKFKSEIEPSMRRGGGGQRPSGDKPSEKAVDKTTDKPADK